QFETVWPRTPSGKIDLSPQELGTEPYRFQLTESRWPLAMISPATSKTISSSMGEYNLPRLTVALHPDDAKERAIESGSKVRVFNELGDVHCAARLDERVRPGVVVMAKGAWRKSSLNGSTPTALCPDHLNVVANGACFNDARVEVELLPPT
ncbi:MAG: molybdopterin dinucleotide binding domain-containing protein, partial [Acidobacteriota bacterium]